MQLKFKPLNLSIKDNSNCYSKDVLYLEISLYSLNLSDKMANLCDSQTKSKIYSLLQKLMSGVARFEFNVLV